MQYISKDDIDQLFYQEKRHWPFPARSVVITTVFIIVGIYILLNAPALSKQVYFWWTNDISQSRSIQRITSDNFPMESKQSFASQRLTNNINDHTQSNIDAIDDNILWIPKIGVKVPIIWDVQSRTDRNTDLLRALEHGVVRYPGTALPDQIGNVFITGHSSNYWWEKGQYKTIFALLDRLVAGEQITLKYQGQLYKYEVTGHQVVSPKEVSVLLPTDEPVLRLMTCTPTGTTWRRLIVTAKLIEPKQLTKLQLDRPIDANLTVGR